MRSSFLVRLLSSYLLGLPTGALLSLGEEAVVEVTGLRVMGVVVAGGEVRPGYPIQVELPLGPRRPLERV